MDVGDVAPPDQRSKFADAFAKTPLLRPYWTSGVRSCSRPTKLPSNIRALTLARAFWLPSAEKGAMSSKYAFSKALKELRFLHCQTSEHSNAVRSFLTRAYPTMKHHNPHTPIMIREAHGTEPRVFARYEFGREKMADLRGLDDKAIEERIAGLVKDAL